MRPTSHSLSALVRSVILREAASADEAVEVHPAQIKLSADVPSRRHVPQQVMDFSDDEARKSQAFVNTDRWREAVMRTYAFLDRHASVADVVVQPIAMSSEAYHHIVSGISGDDYYSRSHVMTREAASRVLEGSGMRLADSRAGSITFIPIVGAGHSVKVSAITLPTAWMTVHSLFDDPDFPLASCGEVRRELEGIISARLPRPSSESNDISPLALLLNCGWAENAFKLVTSNRYEPRPNPRRGMPGLGSVAAPVVGKRYSQEGDIRSRRGSAGATGDSYVKRGKGDIISEIMTIAVTKPEGLQPVTSRLADIPDDIMLKYVRYGTNSAEGDPDLEQAVERGELESSSRKKIESMVLRDLARIKQLTQDLRDRLAADLVDKVVFLTVH